MTAHKPTPNNEQPKASVVEAIDGLSMISLLWMGASPNAVRHHLPKGIARIHTLKSDDDEAD